MWIGPRYLGRRFFCAWVGGSLLFSGACISSTVHATEIKWSSPVAFDAFDRRRDAPVNEEPNYRSDGVYGRFDGELSLMPDVGIDWTEAGWSTRLGIAAYYLNTVGIRFHSADGRWSPVSPRADFNVSVLALACRPLFLLRWAQDWEKGPTFLDLTLDSLTLSVGSFWSRQHSTATLHYGVETELSMGFPLIGRAHGPWLTASVANRLPRVTNGSKNVDMVYGLGFGWDISLGN